MSWADELTDRERENLDTWNLQRFRKYHETHVPELLAEFGSYYGWVGVQSALRNEMSADLFMQMLLEGRKLYRTREAQHMSDMRNAVVTAISKSGVSEMKRLVKDRTGEDHG